MENPALSAAIRERSSGQCECLACDHIHPSPCPNRLGQLANYSRYPVRLTIVDGKEYCQRCADAYPSRPLNTVSHSRAKDTRVPPVGDMDVAEGASFHCPYCEREIDEHGACCGEIGQAVRS